MAFHGVLAVPISLYVLVFSVQFWLVVPQIPTAPLPQLLPPIGTESPVPAAEVPVPAGVLQPQPQVTNMIEALRDAGQFGAIAGLLDGLQMKSLTPMTTWFMPNDGAFSGTSYPKNVTSFLDYHVIRELLPYSRLLTLSTGTRIPTFLGGETCIVTNNYQLSFSIDNAMVVVPDLYSDSTVAVHGINAILDEAKFNRVAVPPASFPSPGPISGQAPPISAQAPSISAQAPGSVGTPAISSAPRAFSPFPQGPSPSAPTLSIPFPNVAAHCASVMVTAGICMTLASISILFAALL